MFGFYINSVLIPEALSELPPSLCFCQPARLCPLGGLCAYFCAACLKVSTSVSAGVFPACAWYLVVLPVYKVCLICCLHSPKLEPFKTLFPWLRSSDLTNVHNFVQLASTDKHLCTWTVRKKSPRCQGYQEVIGVH